MKSRTNSSSVKISKQEITSSAVPALGYRNPNVNNQGTNGYYWSSLENNSTNAHYLNWNNTNAANMNNNNPKSYGMPVRCVQEFIHPIASFKQLPPYSTDQKKDHLSVDLFKAYYDARKHKRNTKSQIRFEMNLEQNILDIHSQIVNRTYKPKPSSAFIVEYPVKREIFAADFYDRVVHHLLFNYINPIFEKTFIDDNYSCRKGRGTLYGIKRLDHHIRSCSKNYTQNCYIMKLDIQAYFMSINRKILAEKIDKTLRKFEDRYADDTKTAKWAEKIDFALVYYLLETVIFNDPTKNVHMKGTGKEWEGLPPHKSMFNAAPYCGLPIGNLTSQLFSNIYLNDLDHFVKRELKVKHYGRYVDDLFIVHNDKNKLHELRVEITKLLSEKFNLTVHPKKIVITDARYGVRFLGAVCKPHRIYPDKKILTNMKQKMVVAKNQKGREICDDTKTTAILNSYLGLLKHYKSYRQIDAVVAGNSWIEKMGRFSFGYTKFNLHPTEPCLKNA